MYMTRVLRYPRMSMMICAMTIACALCRDLCLSAGLEGWSRVLLFATLALLLLCCVLMSCRFFVDAQGVGVGFLLRVRRTDWDDLAAFGLLNCNSRRQYFYGMYRGATDFLTLLHRAPHCGSWGFVVPVSSRLLGAVCTHCPFEVCLAPAPRKKREGRIRLQWHQAAVQLLLMLPSAAVAFAISALALIYAASLSAPVHVAGLTLGAMALAAAGLTMIYRAGNTLITCPGYTKHGVFAGAGLYLPWIDVRFGYVHRFAKMSGMFLLSRPLEEVQRRGAKPLLCLSMPDTPRMLVAYVNYCPHARRSDVE